MMEDMTEEVTARSELTEEQRERIQKNKEKAQSLKEHRKRAKPYDRPANPKKSVKAPPDPTTQSFRNSHAGFIFEEEDSSAQQHKYHRVEEDAPVPPDDLMVCEECSIPFAESYLHSKFQLDVCDKCRAPTGKHSLITKTEAKQTFLLQDHDFDERNGPALPFLLKKNPHSSRWGEMKLYLLCQVEARAHEIWGGEEGLEEAHEKKSQLRGKKREKKFAKEIKALRRVVKTTLPGKSHVHSFPESGEAYDSESDTWTKTCSDCGFQVSFEKM